MEKMMGRCGLVCTECEGFLATQNNDMAKLQEMAEKWGKSMNKEISVESLFCDGCLSDTGRRSGYCKICGVKKCAEEKGLSTCAQCNDYACETLSNFLVHAVKAKENLEEIRAGR